MVASKLKLFLIPFIFCYPLAQQVQASQYEVCFIETTGKNKLELVYIKDNQVVQSTEIKTPSGLVLEVGENSASKEPWFLTTKNRTKSLFERSISLCTDSI